LAKPCQNLNLSSTSLYRGDCTQASQLNDGGFAVSHAQNALLTCKLLHDESSSSGYKPKT